MNHRLTRLLGALALAIPAIALAVPALALAAGELTDAEVRKVDKEGGRLTLKHAEIKHLDMPPMTMVFQVRDRAMLDKLQPGDKVRFKVAQEGGKFTVVEIQSAM